MISRVWFVCCIQCHWMLLISFCSTWARWLRILVIVALKNVIDVAFIRRLLWFFDRCVRVVSVELFTSLFISPFFNKKRICLLVYFIQQVFVSGQRSCVFLQPWHSCLKRVVISLAKRRDVFTFHGAPFPWYYWGMYADSQCVCYNEHIFRRHKTSTTMKYISFNIFQILPTTPFFLWRNSPSWA